MHGGRMLSPCDAMRREEIRILPAVLGISLLIKEARFVIQAVILLALRQHLKKHQKFSRFKIWMEQLVY